LFFFSQLSRFARLQRGHVGILEKHYYKRGMVIEKRKKPKSIFKCTTFRTLSRTEMFIKNNTALPPQTCQPLVEKLKAKYFQKAKNESNREIEISLEGRKNATNT